MEQVSGQIAPEDRPLRPVWPFCLQMHVSNWVPGVLATEFSRAVLVVPVLVDHRPLVRCAPRSSPQRVPESVCGPTRASRGGGLSLAYKLRVLPVLVNCISLLFHRVVVDRNRR